jgi:hypothetical protein
VENPSIQIRPQQRLLDAGHEIFAIDLTRRGDLLSTARVVVPTLSALRREPDVERVLTQSKAQPQFKGVQNPEDLETLAPY